MRPRIVVTSTLALATTLACVLGCGGNSMTARGANNPPINPLAAKHRRPRRTADVHVVISGKTLEINGIRISGKPTIADIQAIFGRPDRTWDSGGANRIHTWDSIGFLAYEPYDTEGSGGDGRCISATFPYKAMSPSFSPKTLFRGTIQLDSNAFDPTLVLPTVKKWPGATQPYTQASIVFDREDFHVFTIQEDGSPHLDLVEISFWQRAARAENTTRKPIPRVADIDEDDCRNGDIPRCTNRALALQVGTAGRRNLERAFELAKIGCAGSDAFACVMLGNMYDAGKGTLANKGEAKTAWKRACTLGYKPLCDPY